MKILIGLILLMLSSIYCTNDKYNQFLSWTKKYQKIYNNEQFFERFQIWSDAITRIEKHNKGNHSYKLAMNQFGDLTFPEFLNHIGATKFDPREIFNYYPDSALSNAPDSLDWRNKGAVTPVANQGSCGSSPYWAAVGAIEGAHVISGQGSLVSLSVQQSIDCRQSPQYGNFGCNGGYINTSFEYVVNNNGIDTNETYPYLDQDGTSCAYTTSGDGAVIDSYVNVPPDENSLLEAILVCPVATAVMVTPDFEYYSSGVFNDSTCTDENIAHGILVIGYGETAEGDQYWTLKNTLGTSWGMEGYMYLERGHNRCGIANTCSYPVINNKKRNKQ